MDARRKRVRRARRYARGFLPEAGWVAAACLAMLACAALPAAAQSAGVCGRSELVRVSLVEWIKNRIDVQVTDCAQVTAVHLSSVSTIRLAWPYSGYPNGGPDAPVDLQAGDFAGLTSLRTIRAPDLRLRNVPAGLFSDSPGMRSILLQNNEIQRLPDDFLKGLPNLFEVRLNGNSITSLPENFFAPLSSIRARAPGYELQLGLGNTQLEVTVVPLGAGRFAAYMPTGAPFDVQVPYVVGGEVRRRLTIPAGDTISNKEGFVGSSIDIGTLPHPPRNHSGYRLVKAAELPVEVRKDGFSTSRAVLNLSPPSVSEGGVAEVWAQHSQPGLGEVRLQVYAYAKPNRQYTLPRTTGLDFTIGENRVLTIPSGLTRSSNRLTITTTDDNRFTWSRQVDVAARLLAGGVHGPGVATLTIYENEPKPVVSLTSSHFSLSENGGSAAVTAVLDRPLPAGQLTVRLSVKPTPPARHHHYQLSGSELTIAAGRTAATGTVTLTATDDIAFVGDRELKVTAYTRYDGYDFLEEPAPLTLTIQEDDPEVGAGGGICARTAGVRAVLLRAIHGVSDCADVTAVHLAAIGTLYIQGFSDAPFYNNSGSVIVNELQRGDFDGLSNLRNLYISGTFLDRLPVGIFDGLSNLQWLAIGENEDLRRLPLGVFTGLPKLWRLDLTGSFRGIPAGLLAELPALTELDLSGNGFGPLEPGVFDGVEHLETVNLRDSGISELRPGLFDGLTSLKGLNLDFNYLRELPDGIFSDLTGLVAVRMLNHWRHLPDGLFEGSPDLRYVLISDGYDRSTTLRRFPDRTFNGLGAPLVHLDFSSSRHTPSLEVSLQALGPGRFRAVAPAGAPLDITLPVSAVNGTIAGGATTLTIPVGALASRELEVTRNAGTTAAVTVNIGALPRLPAQTDNHDYFRVFGLQSIIGRGHYGYQLAKAGDLPLTVIANTGAPQVTLEVAQAMIAEDGGATGVTAKLPAVAEPAADEIRLTVSATAVAPATSADYTLSTTALTIAAGARNSTGTVTIAAVNNDRYTGNRTVRVSAAVTAGTAALPEVQTVTITEDEATLAAALELSVDSIDEEGGEAQVSAALSGPPGAPVVITVTAEPVPPAAPADYLQSGNTLTIAPGATSGTGTVTITAVDDPADRPDKLLLVSAAVAGLPGLSAPAARTLTIVDHDGPPTARLVLDPPAISEAGGRSTVTALLSHASSEPSVLEVQAVAKTPGTNFNRSGSTLTFAAGQTESAGAVTITAVDDSRFHLAPRTVEVRASNRSGPASSPEPVTLTIEEDDQAPPIVNALRLVLTPPRIAENGGQSVVSARLDTPLSDVTTIRVAAAPVRPARANDFTLSGTALTIAAGATVSTGSVSITAQDNTDYAWDKIVTVTATAASGTTTAESEQSLTIEEDEPRPVVSLGLSTDTISEDGGAAEIRARLDGAVSKDTYLQITVEPLPPARRAFDYTVTGYDWQVIRKRETEIGQIGFFNLEPVTVQAIDDISYTGAKQVRVIGRIDPTRSLPWLQDPAPAIITITEDDSQTPGDGICERTQEIQTAITTQVIRMMEIDGQVHEPTCDEVTAAQLAKITQLWLHGERSVMPLVPGDFAGLPQLRFGGNRRVLARHVVRRLFQAHCVQFADPHSPAAVHGRSRQAHETEN